MDHQTTLNAGPTAESTVIEAPRRWPRADLGELWRYRDVAMTLARRNLKARYRQTLLGVVWVLIQPLALMIVFSIAFSFIVRESYYGVPFPVFFLAGLAIWGPSVKILVEGSQSIVFNQMLVTRVYLPRPLVVGSVGIAALVDLAFTLIALQVILLLFGFTPSITYLAVPYLIVIAWMTTLGFGLFFGALNVHYRDIQVGMPFIERLWFFASPLLYPAALVPEQYWPLYYLNPMALVLEGMRWAVAGMPAPPTYAWAEGTIVAALLLAGGYLYFRQREPSFTDVL